MQGVVSSVAAVVANDVRWGENILHLSDPLEQSLKTVSTHLKAMTL